MAYYAYIAGGTVVNVVVAETAEDALLVMPEGCSCVEYEIRSGVIPGWTYDGHTFKEPEVNNE
jgi:hypothetical protein